eukprot:gene23332-9623_t
MLANGLVPAPVHPAHLYRWYNNWMKNEKLVRAKYGEQKFRTWEVFLVCLKDAEESCLKDRVEVEAWSAITPEEGRCTCYQIVCNKNKDDFDRRQYW